jgi:peptidoglycan hydrolase CwlO-like protein
MSNETVTYSLEAVLTRIESKIDSLEKRLDEKIDSLEKRIDERFDKIEDRFTKVEIGQAELKGEIKALDERLSTKIEGLTARVSYQEFTNRGILIALVVAILGGAAKLFGFFPNP